MSNDPLKESLMHRSFVSSGALLLGACFAGCAETTSMPGADAQAVARKFQELQMLIRDENTERIWELLSSKSRRDAERAAEAIHDTYSKCTPAEKLEQENATGLSAAELMHLTGKLVLKTKRLRHRYAEIAEGMIEKLSIERDAATIIFVDAEGDRERLIFVREANQWKAWLRMPRK